MMAPSYHHNLSRVLEAWPGERSADRQEAVM
jgi:hypothetical protein